MNVHAVEKKTIVIKTEEFVKYETVFDLFKILYNIYKMNLGFEKGKDQQSWISVFVAYPTIPNSN